MANDSESLREPIEGSEPEAGRPERASRTEAQESERELRVPEGMSIPSLPDLGEAVIGMYFIG